MSIQKPFSINIKDKTIDTSKDFLLKWQTSGDVSASFSITVYDNLLGTVAWSLPRTYSYAMSYTIPANTLTNGLEYKISVQVWNSLDQTAISQYVIFNTSSTPVVTVADIGTIGNHSYSFEATYSQDEDVPLSTYVVNLYNAERLLLKTSGIKTTLNVPDIEGFLNGLMEHRFDLLKNDTNYFIEFVVTSKIGLTSTSGLIPFTVVYENPAMYFELTADTNPEKASVKLNWKVREVIGKSDVKPTYITGTKLDVRGGKVYFDEGFEISSDFTLKIWFEHLTKNEDVIYLKGSNGTIRVQYKSDNKIHVYKKIGNFNYHYSSNEIDSNGIFLCLQQKDGRMDMYTESIFASDFMSLGGATFEQLATVKFEQIPYAIFS
jgi:hypothetical protein